MPQALALTAIVISFGVTAFLLALAYRSWQTGEYVKRIHLRQLITCYL